MRSLASKLTLCVLALMLLILGVAFAVMYSYNSAETKRHAEKYAMALLEKSANGVAWDFRDVEHILEANKLQVSECLDTPERAMDIIKDIVVQDNMVVGASVAFEPNYYPRYGAHYMLYASVDTLHRLQTRRVTDTSDYDYHQKPWYTDAKRLGHSVWSEPYYDEGCGDMLMTTYSIPLHDKQGALCGVFTADVSLVALSKVVNGMRTFSDDYTFVLSGKGNYVVYSQWVDIPDKNIISRAKRQENGRLNAIGRNMISGKSGTECITLHDKDMLVCYIPLGVSDWSIGYACPYSSILASLNNFTLSVEVALLLLLLLLIVAMRYVIKYHIGPAESLTAATYRISKGEFDGELPEIKTNDEFKRLRDAFEKMQLSLKQYIKDLTEVTQAKQRIESELSIAHGIQMSLIPTVAPDSSYPELDMSALLRPAKEVGGDLYDYLIIDNKLYFTIADVSGKGVPASLIMATIRARFRLICQAGRSAATVVSTLNKAFCEENDANMFVTMFVGVMDLESRRLDFCNAGHNPGVIIDPSGSRYMEVIANLPLGIISDFEYQAQSTTLTPDAVMLFYTDGLTEAENGEHKLLGEEAVAEILQDKYKSSAAEIVALLEHSVEQFADGTGQSDDITLLCVRLNRKLALKNDHAEVSRLPLFVEEVYSGMIGDGEESASKIMMLNLALEEALVNVIDYAYPAGEKGLITLTAEYQDGHILFTLRDRGVPFDPTTVATPDLTLSVKERPIGGLGIHLIRNIMTSVEYRRHADFNELRMLY